MALDAKIFLDKLVARREDLRRLADNTAESRKPVELDQTRVGRLSRMDALQVQAMAQEEARRRAFEIEKIDAALKRMDTGDYGFCVVCGECLPIERLEVDPTATTCVQRARGEPCPYED